MSGASGGGAGVECILVVVSIKRFHVTHAAVTDLDGVLVKYIVQFVLFGGVFVHKLEEDSTDVCLYAYIVWGLYHIMLHCRFLSVRVGCLL